LLANHCADHELLGDRYDADPDRLLEELRDVDRQIAPLMKRGDKLYFHALLFVEKRPCRHPQCRCAAAQLCQPELQGRGKYRQYETPGAEIAGAANLAKLARFEPK